MWIYKYEHWSFECTIRRLGKDESARNGGLTMGGKGVFVYWW